LVAFDVKVFEDFQILLIYTILIVSQNTPYHNVEIVRTPFVQSDIVKEIAKLIPLLTTFFTIICQVEVKDSYKIENDLYEIVSSLPFSLFYLRVCIGFIECLVALFVVEAVLFVD